MQDDFRRLLETPVFQAAPDEELFMRAFRRCVSTAMQMFPEYARFINRNAGDVEISRLTTLENLQDIPPLFAGVLKAHNFELPTEMEVAVRLTSSGSSGLRTEIPLDSDNLKLRVAAMSLAYEAIGIATGPTSALAFLMDPSTTQVAGSVVIDAVLKANSNVDSVRYLAEMTPQGPSFLQQEAIDAVQQAAERGSVLAVGYPALIAHAIQGFRLSGIEQLQLPEGSLVLTGGGWKSFLPGVQLDQSEFRELASNFFGLPSESVRDMYGMGECPAVFVQCESGSYHIPSFSLAEAIDPESSLPVPAGESGLLQLTVPLTTSYPLARILTTDKVRIEAGCDCGREAPFLVPMGRASVARFETCAMKIGRAVDNG